MRTFKSKAIRIIALVIFAAGAGLPLGFSGEELSSSNSKSEEMILTPSTPVEFPVKQFKFGDKIASIQSEYRVAVNDDGQGAHVAGIATISFPNGYDVENKQNLGDYTGPVSIVENSPSPPDGKTHTIIPPDPAVRRFIENFDVSCSYNNVFGCVTCEMSYDNGAWLWCEVCWSTGFHPKLHPSAACGNAN